MEARAVAKYIGISPLKLRLVAEEVKGENVQDALAVLKLAPGPTPRAVAKVIKSAAANAENNFGMAPNDLIVTNIFIDRAATLKRFRPQARGRIAPILRHTSHITVVVEEQE
jgi:large subunit ribosomal protein L22